MMWEAATYTGDIMAPAHDRITVLPTGSTEFHGPHGYLGVDSLIADDLARRVAGSLEGVLLPRVDYTWCPVPTRGYPGTISVPQDVMQAYLTAILEGVLAWGVRGVLVLCAHDGNLGPVTVAADRARERSSRQFIVAVNWWETWSAEEASARFGFTEQGVTRTRPGVALIEHLRPHRITAGFDDHFSSFSRPSPCRSCADGKILMCHRASSGRPRRIALFVAHSAKTAGTKQTHRIIGVDTVRAAAIGHDLLSWIKFV